MKIFARRIEAPTSDKPYATKWQIAVGDSAADPNIRFYDGVNIHGGCAIVIHENENPAVYVEPLHSSTVVRGFKLIGGDLTEISLQ